MVSQSQLDKVQTKKEDALSLLGSTIDKYHLQEYITSGGFGHVFIATVTDNSDRIFALKVPIQSDKRDYKKYLVQEFKIIHELSNRDKGIMAVKLVEWDSSYGMVMDLLGPSLNHYKKKLTLVELVKITIKLLQILQYIHSKGYIHRDITCNNFVLHPSNNIDDGIFCIDFGLAIKHPETFKNAAFCGTETYASTCAHKNKTQSWKDDLESLVYCIVNLYYGIHWNNSSVSDKKERIIQIGLEKEKMTPKTLCKDLPNEFKTLYKYSKTLAFGQYPKYNSLIQKFTTLLEKLQKVEKVIEQKIEPLISQVEPQSVVNF